MFGATTENMWGTGSVTKCTGEESMSGARVVGMKVSTKMIISMGSAAILGQMAESISANGKIIRETDEANLFQSTERKDKAYGKMIVGFDGLTSKKIAKVTLSINEMIVR